MTTDTTAVDSDAEPTEAELLDLAAAHGITVPDRPPRGWLVRRSRYDALSDDLATILVALATATRETRYWRDRVDQAHAHATEAEQSATKAHERAHRIEADRDHLREQLKPAPHHTGTVAVMVQHLDDECADCAATLPDQPHSVLSEIGRTAQEAGAVAALRLVLQEVDRRIRTKDSKKETAR